MKKQNNFVKSPMNYPGNKYKLLPQLFPLFPKQINNFIDLFAGGLDISCNIQANQKYANDINKPLIEIYKAFQTISYEELINFINMRIKEFELTKYNYDGFIRYRTLYNNNSQYHTPLDLFVLSRFAYNNLLDIKNGISTTGFGFDHSDFNITQRAHTKFLHEKVSNIIFSSLNFLDFNINNFNNNDFLYADPPYLISGSVYKTINWTEKEEKELYEYLDRATEIGLKWGLSNVVSHKGDVNDILAQWMNKYNVYDINSNYSNSYYKHKDNFTIEVFITNY